MDQFQTAQTDADPTQSRSNGQDMVVSTQHVQTPPFAEKGRHTSKLRLYCFAKAASNKELDSEEVEFNPLEHMPFTDGEINEEKVDYQASGEEYIGGGYNATIKTSNSMVATWLREGNGNRMTPPDIRRGERLKIYQFADDPKFYWESVGTDNHKRRLETVIWAFNSDPDMSSDSEEYKTDYDHSYSFEASTHKKWFRLHTTQLNEEFCGWDIELNLDKGFLLAKDTKGNYFSIDSANNRIELYNADGSHFDMHKEDLRIFTPRSIILDTKNFRLNSLTNEYHAMLYDITYAPIISHMGTGTGSISFSSAWRVETSTMGHEGGYISEATQQRVIQSDHIKMGTPSEAARRDGQSAGMARLSALIQSASSDSNNSGGYEGFDNGEYETASGYNAGGNATSGERSIGTDLGDVENADNLIDIVAKRHDLKTQEQTTEVTGKQTVKVEGGITVETPTWDLKGSGKVSRNWRVGFDSYSRFSYAANITYNGTTGPADPD